MRTIYLSQTLVACTLGLILVGCGATDGSDAAPVSDNGTAVDLFAPASASTNASANLFPDPLANTIASPVNSGMVNALNVVPVPVVQQVGVTQQRIAQSCIRPTTKAALSSYAANCTIASSAPITASQVITSPTVATQRIIQQPVTQVATSMPSTTTSQMAVASGPSTFTPAVVSCDSTPTTKAGLAAYRANCMQATSAPVEAPAAQTSMPQPASSSTDNSVGAQPAEAQEVSIEPSPSAPSSNSIYDCSKDPTTGAELALFRAYCQ